MDSEITNRYLNAILFTLEKTHGFERDREIERLRNNHKLRSPKSLIPHGKKVYSQNEEDGLLQEIFNRIGVTNRFFVELGVGDGRENNSLTLLFKNWRGMWIEGNDQSIAAIRRGFVRTIAEDRLFVEHAFITRDNIDKLIGECVTGEIDLLSVDLDGNDWHIFSAIKCVTPRVLIMEYNAKFIPPIRYCLDYKSDHQWQGDDCFGVSLQFLEDELGTRGYCLVGCNLTGSNAFFVRSDLVGNHFMSPFTAENHYQPPRYYLSPFPGGHPPGYGALETRLREDGF